MMKKYYLFFFFACQLLLVVGARAQTTISTFATSAQGINNPQGLVFDKAGNLVVANTGNNTIIKIAPDGTATTFCSDPLLNAPHGLAFDKAGNLFVANFGSNTILKINSSGAATVFADSLLNQPYGLAFDTSGNLYATNYSGGLISKIASTGAVRTIAFGAFSATNALFAIAIDNNNYLYVTSNSKLSNNGNESIYKIALRNNSKLGYFPQLSGFVASFPDSYGLSVDSAQNIIQSGRNTSGSTNTNSSLKALYSSLNLSSSSISYGATAVDAQGYLYAYYIEANSIVKISAVDLRIQSDRSAACIGLPITFTALINNSGNAPTFQWMKNGVVVGSNSNVYVDSGLSSSSDVISCTLTSSLTDVSPNSITNSISLTVYDTTTTVDSATAIGSYTWNATTYNQSGIYYYTYNNANGCPTNKKLVLNLYPVCGSTDTVKVNTPAANYQWHGTTYTKSGTYSFDSLNVAGCDSLMRLVLNLIPACPNDVIASNTNTSSYKIDNLITTNFWGGGYGPNGNFFLTKSGQNSTVFYANDTIFNISSPTQTGNGTPSCRAPAAFNNYASQMAILPSTANQICYAANQVYFVDGSITKKCQFVFGNQFVFHKAQAFSISTTGTYAIAFQGVSSTKTITIVDKPEVTISANVTDNKFIKGQSVVFTSAITNEGDYMFYTWLKNGNVVSYDDTYADATLNNWDLIACSVSSYLQSGSRSTTTSNVLTMSTCTPTSSTTNETICSNQLPYAWNGQTITGAGTYQATLTNAGGCDSTATLVLTVTNSVTPSVTITPNPAMPIAKGTNVVFTAVASNGGTGTTYAWYKNAVNLNVADATLQTSSITNGDTIKCVITSNAACVTTPKAESNKIGVVEIPVCATPTKFSITGGGVYCSTGSGLPLGLSSSEVGVNYQLLIPSPKNPNQWGTLNAPIAGTGSAINFGNYTAATYRVLAKTAVESCQDTMSGIATITSTNKTIWAGKVSNDLSNAANIEGCAMSSSVDLDIAAGLFVYPVVSGTVSVKSVSVQAGASLSVSGKLNVSGSFTNNGTPNLGTGSVVLNGTGLLIGYSIFNNLEIAGDYNINKAITTKVEVTGNLKLTSGTFTTIGKLTLKSTASKTALIQENGGSINGSINMERYVSGSNGYHHLSSPISNNTVSTWGNYFNIIGKDGVRSATKGGTPATLQEYREAANTKPILDSAYYNYTNGDAVTASGKGFAAWFVKVPTTLVSVGTPTSGIVSVPVTYAATNATTKGWNLVGNPYPSPISWSALRSLNPGVWGDQACYIWKATKGVNGQWQTYNGTVGTNGVGNVIASSQAFFVLVNQSTNLTFSNSIRTTDVNPTFFSTQQLKQLRLQIVNPANLAETDEVVAYTKAGIAQPIVSVKPPMPAEATNASLSFVHDGKQAAIEAIANFKAGDELALNISTPVAGIYLLKVSEYNHNLPAYLKDAKTGSYTELKAGAEVAIASDATTSNTRYSVVFGRPAAAVAAVAAANNSYKVFSAKKAIQVTNEVVVSNAKVVIYNTIGQQIATATMNGTRLTIPVSASNNATYVVKIAGETVGKVIVP